MQVIIKVKGGMVENVYSDTDIINVVIFDFDSDCKSEKEESEYKSDFNYEIRNMHQLY